MKVDVLDVLWHIVSVLLLLYQLTQINTPLLPLATPKVLLPYKNWLILIDVLAMIWPICQLLDLQSPSGSKPSRAVLSYLLNLDSVYHHVLNALNFVRALHVFNVAIYEFQWGKNIILEMYSGGTVR